MFAMLLKVTSPSRRTRTIFTQDMLPVFGGSRLVISRERVIQPAQQLKCVGEAVTLTMDHWKFVAMSLVVSMIMSKNNAPIPDS